MRIKGEFYCNVSKQGQTKVFKKEVCNVRMICWIWYKNLDWWQNVWKLFESLTVFKLDSLYSLDEDKAPS